MRSAGTAIEVIPAAGRLVRSLRDLGYDFPQAVADLVDNSVTAGARRIAIDLRFEGPDSWLRVTDDGHGMAGTEITEAMRYGSHQTYAEEDLGKFGLGLKTASLSQCRQLIVASRRGRERARVNVRVLDLDHVSETNRWEILAPTARRLDERLTQPLDESPGTVVLWQSLDRVLGYKIPWGKRAQTALEALGEQLALHLGMVFHRFLAGEVPDAPKVRMLVNGRRVTPWDPFARAEPATQVLPGSDIDVQTDEGAGLVFFQPYVLPPREEFSSEDAFHRLAGPRKWNAQQGLYIYRSNRLVQSGGWSRMRAPDEHLKLARAAIDFFPELDSAFQVNVAKVRVSLPPDLREQIARPFEQFVRTAQAAYRRSGGAVDDAEAATRRSTRLDGRVVRGALDAAARRTGTRRALRQILHDLGAANPEVAQYLSRGGAKRLGR